MYSGKLYHPFFCVADVVDPGEWLGSVHGWCPGLGSVSEGGRACLIGSGDSAYSASLADGQHFYRPLPWLPRPMPWRRSCGAIGGHCTGLENPQAGCRGSHSQDIFKIQVKWNRTHDRIFPSFSWMRTRQGSGFSDCLGACHATAAGKRNCGSEPIPAAAG